MSEEKRAWKWAVVIVPIVAAALAIYPPSRKLKAGIDLAGGSSLLFEIDTSGLDATEKIGMAARVMEVLKRRVDPNGQMNLIWRPIGNNRLEIQMPRPPEEALKRRGAWEAARDRLNALNITRIEVETMLHTTEAERDAAKAALVRGVTEREGLLDELISAYAAYEAASENVAEARQKYEDAFERALSTNLNIGRLTDVLALANRTDREAELEKLRRSHASETYRAAITAVTARHDEWAADKGALEDPEDLKRRLMGAGVLEFTILAERDSSSPTMTAHDKPELRESISKYVDQLHERGPRRHGSDAYQWHEVADILDFTNRPTLEAVEAGKEAMDTVIEKYAGKWYVLAHAGKEFGLRRDSAQKWKLVAAYRGIDSESGGPAVNFELDSRGGRQFAKLTSENLNRPLVILLDNVAQSYAYIQSMIREHGQIRGRTYTQEKVAELVSTLRAGSLPARLVPTPLMENTVGPSLGEYNRTQGTRAALIGGAIVGLLILIYYRFAGLVANVALALNLLLTLAIMALMEATFTLPGIAGLVLTVGMAVDANVLIFERMREERDRGVGLRKALKLGYEKAFSAIFDSNLTTLLTCIVLGYVGTEEVKGFAMVLGFGLVTSMYTALFVTRVIFTTLIDLHLLTKLSMFRLMARPSVEWMGLRRFFWPASLVMVVLAVSFTAFVAATNKEALFDIEFLGGTSVQIELKKGETVTDEEVRQLVAGRGGETKSSVEWLDEAADAVSQATVARGSTATSVVVSSAKLLPAQLEALVRPVLEPSVERGGFRREGQSLILESKLDDKGSAMLTVEGAQAGLAQAAKDTRKAAQNLEGARIQTVRALEASKDAPMAFEVITVEPNKELVQAAILAVMNPEASARNPKIPRLDVELAVSFGVLKNDERAPEGYWPIQAEDRYLSDAIGDIGGSYDIQAFKGGVAIVFDELNPPLTTSAFDQRVREIRLQPEFAQFEVRPFHTFGLMARGEEEGQPTYARIAYVAVDPNLPYYDDPKGVWDEQVATVELEQVRQALATEKSLRKVNQFTGQVAFRTVQQAIAAIALSLAALAAYIWIRFGSMHYGLAASVALVHNVCVPLGLVAVSHYVYDTFLGRALALSDFKIDLTMIAAFLTILGYSLNDTIVVFDRIRENRGRLRTLTPAGLNMSINQTLSRTMLTGGPLIIAILIMYLFGGPGIHGFSFTMLIGVVAGTYGTIAIAVPLLCYPRVLHLVVYVMLALGVFGAFAVIVGGAAARGTLLTVAGILVGAGFLWAVALELRSARRAVPVAA